jgi:hypothetical protein
VTTRRPSRPSWAVSRILAASQLWVAQIAPRRSTQHEYQWKKNSCSLRTGGNRRTKTNRRQELPRTCARPAAVPCPRHRWSPRSLRCVLGCDVRRARWRPCGCSCSPSSRRSGLRSLPPASTRMPRCAHTQKRAAARPHARPIIWLGSPLATDTTLCACAVHRGHRRAGDGDEQQHRNQQHDGPAGGTNAKAASPSHPQPRVTRPAAAHRWRACVSAGSVLRRGAHVTSVHRGVRLHPEQARCERRGRAANRRSRNY